MQQILCTYSLLLIMAIEAIVVRTWRQLHDPCCKLCTECQLHMQSSLANQVCPTAAPQVCMIETYKERQQNAVKQREARRRYLARCRAVQELERQVGGCVAGWLIKTSTSERVPSTAGGCTRAAHAPYNSHCCLSKLQVEERELHQKELAAAGGLAAAAAPAPATMAPAARAEAAPELHLQPSIDLTSAASGAFSINGVNGHGGSVDSAIGGAGEQTGRAGLRRRLTRLSVRGWALAKGTFGLARQLHHPCVATPIDSGSLCHFVIANLNSGHPVPSSAHLPPPVRTGAEQARSAGGPACRAAG